MKKIIFSVVCIALILLSVFLLKFTDGWFVWYLLALPWILRVILKLIYKKLFTWSQSQNKFFNILTLLAYILIIVIIIYAIITVDLGNSWI